MGFDLDILDLAEILIDDRVGIIKQVQEVKKEACGPDFIYFLAQTCNLSAINPIIQQNSIYAAGVAADRRRALAKALGEAVERYCGSTYNYENNFPTFAYKNAPFPCVHPEDFALFSSEQYQEPDFPFKPFNQDAYIRWVPALDLYSGTTKYVPAAKVFLPYICCKEHEEDLITPQISTGMACHRNFTLATLTAICEVVERDAVAITWQGKLARERIRLDTLSSQNMELVTRLKQTGSSVHLLHLAMDHGIPVILSVLTHSSSACPAFLIGAAAHLDPERAVQKSLEELAQIWHMAFHRMAEPNYFSSNRKMAKSTNIKSHAELYFDHSNVKLTKFLFSNEEINFSKIKNLTIGDPAKDLEQIVERIKAVNSNVYISNVTTEDIRSLGLSVVRAIIPGFHPLFMGHKFRALGGKRLWKVPQKLGYPGVTREKGDNPSPHPFA